MFWEWRHHSPFSDLLHASLQPSPPLQCASKVPRNDISMSYERQQCAIIDAQGDIGSAPYARKTSESFVTKSDKKSQQESMHSGAFLVTPSFAKQPLLNIDSRTKCEPTIQDAMLEWEIFVLKGWREIRERLPNWQSVEALYHILYGAIV